MYIGSESSQVIIILGAEKTLYQEVLYPMPKGLYDSISPEFFIPAEAGIQSFEFLILP
jgi:hypothetical protein